MQNKRKIPIDSGETQEQRDEKLRETGSVPEEVFTESPEEADVVAESDPTALQADVQLLKQRCDEAQKCADEEHDRFLRTLAEFDNFRKRSREEFQQVSQFAVEDLVIRLLPVLDNFERAIKTAEEIKDYDALHGGVILILRQLRDILTKEGVKPIEAQGKLFDPNLHEAVMRLDTDEYPDGMIVEEFQIGYMIGDKVIRPSMVKVARHPDG